ncbi:synaptonemal complex protein 1-like, partial [Lingula anatina]|uniref:Synaptonemal complex protein 1-like n=1 Tax=Lingula anatina TaxID=7574 RepID=A0A1S3K534_LINAN
PKRPSYKRNKVMQKGQIQESRQPFFKPLHMTSQENCGFFNLNNINNSQVNSNAQFFNQQEIEQERNEWRQDEFSSLSRLKQTAEQLREWEVKNDIEIKKKEHLIQEGKQTIESLRSLSLDLQLQNEELSRKLQEELENQEEIAKKVEATRELCALLKSHISRLDEKLLQCEREKTELSNLQKDYGSKFEELSFKFQQLQLTSSEQQNALSNQLIKEKEEKAKCLEEERQKLVQSKTEMLEVEKQLEIKLDELDSLSAALKENQKEAEVLQQTVENLQSKLQVCQGNSKDLEERIKALSEKLLCIEDEKEKLKTELELTKNKLAETIENKDKLAVNFDETEKLYVEKLGSLKDDLSQMQDILKQERAKLIALQDNMSKSQKLMEDLQMTKDMLILERTDNTDKIKELESDKVLV